MNLALQKYSGDYANAAIEPAIELQPAVQVSPQVALALNFGRGTVSDQRFFRTTLSTIDLKMIYHLFPEFPFTPYFMLGGGMVHVKAADQFGNRKWP